MLEAALLHPSFIWPQGIPFPKAKGVSGKTDWPTFWRDYNGPTVDSFYCETS